MPLESTQSILSAALREAGLPDAVFSAAGMAETEVHGLRVALEYAASIDSLILYCSLGVLPCEPSHELYEYLLDANLMGKGTGGGHIGLFGPGRTLIFSVTLPVDQLDGPRLANAFDRFAEKAAVLIADVEERGSSAMEPANAAFMANALWV